MGKGARNRRIRKHALTTEGEKSAKSLARYLRKTYRKLRRSPEMIHTPTKHPKVPPTTGSWRRR